MAQPSSSHQRIKDESDEERLPVKTFSWLTNYNHVMQKLKSSHRNNEHVNRILRGLKDSFVAKVSQTNARKEVHQTFRSNRSNVKEGRGGPAMKFDGRVPTERRWVPDGMVRVYSVAALPIGLSAILKAKGNIVPDQHELLRLQDHGLGVIDLVGGFFFGNTWGPASMHVFLRGLLPKLFSHFAKSDPWVMSINKEDDEEIRTHQLPYVLLSRSGKTKFQAIKAEHPDGPHYLLIKSRSGAGWKESQIFIAPRQAIDENVYEL
ncbi:uncharacterized protein LAESUDRAFT_718678, partial [Laetiporus sulphureus 93-53]